MLATYKNSFGVGTEARLLKDLFIDIMYPLYLLMTVEQWCYNTEKQTLFFHSFFVSSLHAPVLSVVYELALNLF